MMRRSHQDEPRTETNVDVAEAYSRPRMTAMAEKLGMRAGAAIDLRTVDEDGNAWDLADKNMQEKALRKIDEEKPWILTLSPPCTDFCSLQNWNFPKMEDTVVQKRLEQAIEHLAFAVLLCARQAEGGAFLYARAPCRSTVLESRIDQSPLEPPWE